MDEAVIEKHPRQTEASARKLPDNDEAANARVRRKLDLHMMPLFFVLYMLAFLDRGNIGNAEVAGMGTALKLSSSQYAWFSTIFYITYIIFEFCIVLWKIFPPHLVGAIVVFGWCVCQSKESVRESV